MIAESIESAPIAQPARKDTRFNPLNAREMSARSAQARRLTKQMRELGELPKPLLPDERYRLLNLSRVQLQLERHWKELRNEPEPAKRKPILEAIDRLASLQKTFSSDSSDQKPSQSSRQKPPEAV